MKTTREIVAEMVAAAKAEEKFGRKVWLVAIFRQAAEAGCDRATAEELLLEANREGQIRLTRADLWDFDRAIMAASEMSFYVGKSKVADFHFVEV